MCSGLYIFLRLVRDICKIFLKSVEFNVGLTHNVVEFQGLIDAHEQFKQTLGEADKEYNAIIGLVQEVQRISQQYGITGGADNPYTTLSAQVWGILHKVIITI